MNKLSKQLLASVLIVSSLGFVGGASAIPFGEGPESCMRGGHKMGPGHKYGGRGFNMDRMAGKLNLADDQRAQIETIMEDSKQQMTALGDQMQENRGQLRELLQKSPLNEAEVRKVAEAQGDLKADMIVLRAQQRAKVNALLTDDQRAQMEDMRGGRRGYR